MKIQGVVTFQKIGTGFWGIVADDGKKYEPVNLPARFQKEGERGDFKVEKVESFSLFMWGTPIKIIK